MMMQQVDHKANKASLWLFVIALASIITTWALHTPDTDKKAEQVPALQKQLSIVKCQRAVARQAAGQAVAAFNDTTVPLPNLDKAKKDGCSTPALKGSKNR